MKNLSRAVSLVTISCLFIINFAEAAEKIDINVAPLTDLVKIIHIGEARALELISLRPFSSLDDLDRIKGIGVKRIEDIKKQGLAWVGPPAEPSQSVSQTIPEKVKTNSPPGKEAPAKPNLIKKVVLKDVAASGEQAAEPSSLFVFLTAAALAGFSGATVLFLKKRLK